MQVLRPISAECCHLYFRCCLVSTLQLWNPHGTSLMLPDLQWDSIKMDIMMHRRLLWKRTYTPD